MGCETAKGGARPLIYGLAVEGYQKGISVTGMSGQISLYGRVFGGSGTQITSRYIGNDTMETLYTDYSGGK